MNQAYLFTGIITEPLRGLGPEGYTIQPPTRDEEADWLRENPRQVARIRRIEVPLDETLCDIKHGQFTFSIRLRDDNAPEGWRLARFHLPAMADYDWDAGQTLDDVWPQMAGNPEQENLFVLRALNEAVYTGNGWAEAVMRSLILFDKSGLDPEEWSQDFTPHSPKATV